LLVFITCVKHPENSQSYENVWRLLNKTLYSVCNQIDQDFRVIVVCDKKKPLFHHDEIINKYTEFIEVDFPSHGENVVENFNGLGNLSPPLEDPSWWVRWKGQNDFLKKNTEEYMHIANVVLNMGSKLTIGIIAAEKFNPEYVMFFDADDFVGNDISEYVNSRPGENGWIMAHGYKMVENRILPTYNRNSICGTGNIYNHSLLMKFIGDTASENNTQTELFENIDSEFLITIGKHQKTRSYFEEKEYSLLEYPFRSVVYYLWHNESSEYIRKIIRGEKVDLHLRNSKKSGNSSSISSRMIDYFNILPNDENKIFCVGLQKTGTTSIEWLLRDMGKRVATYYKNWDTEFTKKLEFGDLSEIKRKSVLFNAFQDAPWFLYYQEFDKWYPGSKFILTNRDSDSWWKSFSHYFEFRTLPIFKLIYGFENPVGHRKKFIEQYEKHNNDVIKYFKDRPDDLLVVDISNNNAFNQITKFIGGNTSLKEMPHKNATQQIPKKNIIRSFAFKLKKMLLNRKNIIPALKLFSKSQPSILIGGSKEFGADLLLSILSCNPNIHAIKEVQLTSILRHPLSNDRSLKPKKLYQFGKSPIDISDLFQVIISKKIKHLAKRWCGVSPLGVLVYDQIIKYYGKNIRILNIVRDGRDVVTEPDKKVMDNFSVPCDMWVHDVKAGLKFKDHPQVKTIRYEDLIQHFTETVKEIYTFIGEENVELSLNYPRKATIIAPEYLIGKWSNSRYAKKIEELYQTPGAIDCLKHYKYIE
jgi:hypothetical protein